MVMITYKPLSIQRRNFNLMALTDEQIGRIARLARIALSDDERAAALTKLDSTFGMIEQIQAVDTAQVEPMSHPQELSARLRDDRVTETDRRQAYQHIAPQTEDGLYLVPKVIE